jgi:hypothetical protein
MGLGDLTPDSGESSSGGKSTHIKFWNPRNAGDEISEGTEHRHKQEYYDAAQRLREMLGQNINVPVGEFLVAVVEAEQNENFEPLRELFNTITSDASSEGDDEGEELEAEAAE